MKAKSFFTTSLTAIAFICTCADQPGDLIRDNSRDPNGSNWHPGLITAGAFNFTGSYPAADTLTYTDKSGESLQTFAYPGQVQVFADPAVADTTIVSLIRANGGTIIGQIPTLGYYLVSVIVGTEKAFISAVNANSNVKFAIPNTPVQLSDIVDLSDVEGPNGELPTVPNLKAQVGDGVYLYVKDDYVNSSNLSCSGYALAHGTGTSNIASNGLSGTGEQMNIFSKEGTTVRPNDIAAANATAFQDMTFNGTGRAVINLSLQGAYEDANHNALDASVYRTNEYNLLRSYAAQLNNLAIASPNTFNQTVIIVSAGNGVRNAGDSGLDLKDQIQKLHDEFPMVFASEPGTHMIIVGGTQYNSTAVDRGFNYSTVAGDMVYAPARQVQVDANGCTADGTSFAAPEVSNVIARLLAANPNATVSEVTQAFMNAAADNGNLMPKDSAVQARLCSYSIAPTSRSFGPGNGSGTVTVTTTGSGCAWVAKSNASWITTGSSGSGNGTATYTVAAMTGLTSQRTGTMTIAGRIFTVTQHTADWCTYSISSTSQSFDVSGGSGAVTVTSTSGCTWTAASNASWITITSSDSGTGNGTVGYSVLANATPGQRTGTITIAGQTFLVTQSGVVEHNEVVEYAEDVIPTSGNCYACIINITVTSAAPGATVSVSSSWGATGNRIVDASGTAALSLQTIEHCPCLSGSFSVDVDGYLIATESSSCF